MSSNTNRLVNQEGQERYVNEAAAVATGISQNDDDFFDAVVELNKERIEEKAEMSPSQRARGLTNNVAGNAADLGA